MNNGKVRIYELSKELDLDNRDILVICEQLNIAVKSHSSTISDAEADGIRNAARTYVAAVAPSPHKPAPSRKTPTDDARNDATLTNQQKKQQILEIRRPAVRAGDESDKPELMAPPSGAISTSQPAAKSTDPPVKTADSPRAGESPRPAPVKPARTPASSGGPAEISRDAATPSKPPRAQATAPVDSAKAVAPKADGQKNKADSPKAEPQTQKLEVRVMPPVEVPVSVKPPARPENAARSEGGAGTGGGVPRPNTANKPVLKLDRPAGGSAPVPGGAPRKPAAGGAPDRKPGAPGGRRPDGGKPGEGGGNRPQIVELKRPRATDPIDDSGIDAAEPVALKGRPSRPVAPTVELLAKPTPPKARRKPWEEEETVEFPEKAKTPAKGKRRPAQVDDDDDDDLDGSDDDDDSIVSREQVAISLSRPPKPKSTTTTTTTQAPVGKSSPTAGGRRGGGGGNNKYQRMRDRREQNALNKQEKPEIITLTGSVTVQELAQMMAISETDIIRNLFMKGIAATVTQTLDVKTATQVAEDMDILVDKVEKESEARKVTEMVDADDVDNLIRRPPVVTIMGHVDHGKTSLLDSIRKTKVAAGEAGGITQHIGAYHVDVTHNGKEQQVVFLDTPGHEAFTAMRARGARVTDIAVLVVAADDGVQPQTIEAISHAKAAGVPLIVAINKMDKEAAQLDRVKQELIKYELVSEEFGGDTIMVPVSALTGQNLDKLLEMLLLVAEVEDLTANPARLARGTVIEAHLDKGKGSVATLLVQNGTLHVGDIIVAGSSLGKVRAMVDDRGRRVKDATPSFAVEVLGLGDVPSAGDEFQIYSDEKEARAIADSRAEVKRQSRLMAAMSSRRVSLNTISGKAQEGELKELNIVLKADVQGSVEAILGSLKQLPQGEVQVRVLFAAPGEISETDVDLAAASEAVLIGFNTTLATGARQAADRAGVDVREYNIIYALLDDIQGAMEGLLEPELVEEPLGEVEVRAVFSIGKGAVAGCYVRSGKAVRNCKVRVHRGNEKVFEGNLDSLKRMKEDTKEVASGYECGLGIDNFNAWKEGDIIETYRMITKRRTLSTVR
jgi:translation initiation factor IF-2